jgi:hypothetical protein
MNDIEKSLLSHNYKDEKVNKQRYIYRRTKKERIKNKAFTKLLFTYMAEKKVAVIGGVVLIDQKIFLELKRFEKPGEPTSTFDWVFEGKDKEYDELYKDYI